MKRYGKLEVCAWILGLVWTLGGPSYAGQWLKTMTINVPAPYASFSDITADDFDNLYVLWWSTSAHVIQKYDKSGNPIFSFGSDIQYPTTLYSDGGGNVYVKEDILPTWPSHAIHKYSSNGTLLQTLTVNYYAPMFYVDLVGNVYVVQYTGWYSYRIHKFNPSFVETNALDVGYFPSTIQPTPSGTLYILGGSANYSEAIYEYDANLNFITTIVPSHFSSFGGWAPMKTPHLFDAQGQIQAIAFYPYNPNWPANSEPQIFYRLDSSFNIAESQSVPLENGPTTFDGNRLFYVAHNDASSGFHVYQYVYDRPPQAVQYIGPAGAYGTHYSSATLAWNPSTDPDGDPITYQVFFGTDPVHPNLLGTASNAFFPSGPLSFGATYYWQVFTQDFYSGIPLLQTQAPEVGFNLNFVNNPPDPFSVISGSGTILTRLSTATLSWQPSIDPDGDPVFYTVEASSVPAPLAVVQTSTATSFPLAIQFGTTYYWTVFASDPFGAQTHISSGTQTLVPQFLNDPPAVSDASSTQLPAGTIHTSQNLVFLRWPAYSDPEGDVMSYSLYAGQAEPLPLAYLGTSSSFTLTGLSFNTAYQYRVAVSNPFGATAVGPSGSFTLVPNSVQTDPYNYPNPFRIGQGTNFVFPVSAPVGRLKVSVYSVHQRLVWSRDFGPFDPGVYQLHWDGKDMNGQPVFSSLYMVMFDSSQGKQSIRVVGVK